MVSFFVKKLSLLFESRLLWYNLLGKFKKGEMTK